MAVYAATRNHLLAQGRDPLYYLKRDLMNGAVGVLLAVAATRCNLRVVAGLLPSLYVGTLLALVAVLTPLGATINGAHAWFRLGPVELEPSEFFKVVLVLISAVLLGDIVRAERTDNRPEGRAVLRCLAVVAVPLLLVLTEPALGVAIVLVVMVVLQVTVSGASRVWVAGLLALGLLSGAAAAHLHVLKPYQQARFTAFLAPQNDTSGVGYHFRAPSHRSFVSVGTDVTGVS